jgi:hypothetical protein
MKNQDRGKGRKPSTDLKSIFDRIPWASRGRETSISKLGRSLVPVGNKTGGFPKGDPKLYMTIQDPEHETWVMDIQGTAFQVGEGKLLTCWHVIETLRLAEQEAYLYARSRLDGVEAQRPYPFAASFRFFDPRFEAGGSGIVDAGMLLCPAVSTPEMPYEVPVARWGDSTKVGVGDRVLIGGYPLGRDMFFLNSSNRGLIQPSFFEGIISAVIPAIQKGETRLLQISSIAMGGISGGVVCEPTTGKVLGMVTSGLTEGSSSLPITYAIPSEVLQPWADAISFDGTDGRR